MKKYNFKKLGIGIFLFIIIGMTSGCYFSEIKVEKDVLAFLHNKYNEKFTITDIRQNMMLPFGGEYYVTVASENKNEEPFDVRYGNSDSICDYRDTSLFDDILAERMKQKFKKIFEGSDFYLGYGVRSDVNFGNTKTAPTVETLDDYINSNQNDIGIMHKILFIVDDFSEVSDIVEILKNHLELFEHCDSYEGYSIAFTKRSMMDKACEALYNSANVWRGNNNVYFFDVLITVNTPQELMNIIDPTEVGRIIKTVTK